MSSNKRSSTNKSDNNVPMLNQLLAVATEAQGDRPVDQNLTQMSEEDRAWLEDALSQISADSDPVKKLKRWMTRLEEVAEPNEANLEDIRDILEEIEDLVCDLDLAQYFCCLNGIPLIQRFLHNERANDPCSALFAHLIGVLAQYNEKVQQLLLRQTLLEHCIAVIVDENRSVDYRHSCVGACSAMVKAYLPALIRFVELCGPAKLMQCFSGAVEKEPECHRLAHRCAVAAVALKNSYSLEVLNVNADFRRVLQCPEEMQKLLLDKSDPTKWTETLEFLKN